MANERQEMHDLILNIMVSALKNIADHHYGLADAQMDGALRWIKVMRSMMPEQMQQAMDDIRKTLEEQKSK